MTEEDVKTEPAESIAVVNVFSFYFRATLTWKTLFLFYFPTFHQSDLHMATKLLISFITD